MATDDRFQYHIQFSPVIVGAMRLGEWGANLTTTELERFVEECLDMGLRDFDHADIYGHYTEESRFGILLKKRPDLKNKVQITTKCGIQMVTPNRPEHRLKSYNSTKKHILQSADNSLQALNVDHLDVLLIHRPDYLMDAEEVAEAFSVLHRAGKVHAFGVSNFTTSQLELLHQHFPLITNQLEISLLQHQALDDGTLNQCQRLKITPSAWSPLGGGSVFQKTNDARLLRIQLAVQQMAQKHNATADQILLAWLLKHPAGIIPVIGTSKIERVRSARNALKIQLSHEDWYELLEAVRGEEVP